MPELTPTELFPTKSPDSGPADPEPPAARTPEDPELRVANFADDSELRVANFADDSELRVANFADDSELRVADVPEDPELRVADVPEDPAFRVADVPEDPAFRVADVPEDPAFRVADVSEDSAPRGVDAAEDPPTPTEDLLEDPPTPTEDLLEDPALYLNRELTWLAFNERVLHEAEDPRVPLLERVKFLAIVGSNLDEFIMKRIGGLKQQVGAGVTALTVDGRTPSQQIVECYEKVHMLEDQQQATLRALRGELVPHGIEFATYDELSSSDQKKLRDYYYDNIFPLVTPQTSDPAHPFPFVSNLSLNLLITYSSPGDTEECLARVKVPVGAGIPRFLKLDGERRFVLLESVMVGNLDLLFPGARIESCALFRVTRNANTERTEEGADDLLEMIETEMRDRRIAPIVRLEVTRDMRGNQRGMLAAELGLDEETDVFDVDGLLSMRDLMELTSLEAPELYDPPFAPVDHPAFAREGIPVFHIIREAGSLLVHHPYQSYATSIERFLRDASRDPKVSAIKMTLYRTDSRSKAIDHLIAAARNGKQVAVVVELKARFEEEANIRWANRLEEAGIHVTYGVLGLKTHCKAILVVRRDYAGLRRYAHIGTGNYNADTARHYTDVGLFTADPLIGQDLTELFNYLTTGYKPKRNYSKLLPAPKHCKAALLRKVEREIEHVGHGRPGHIQIKTNALEDADLTRALYRASRAGVDVELIVRDSCRIRPGVPGLSDRIRVISVIGRFLEHSRIYYFANGGNEEYYIGSADCMGRNLESRVEVLAPVEAVELRKELRHILNALLAEPRGAWEMQRDGSYRQLATEEGSRSAQQALIDRAAKHHKGATRLKKRGLRSTPRRRED